MTALIGVGAGNVCAPFIEPLTVHFIEVLIIQVAMSNELGKQTPVATSFIPSRVCALHHLRRYDTCLRYLECTKYLRHGTVSYQAGACWLWRAYRVAFVDYIHSSSSTYMTHSASPYFVLMAALML